MWTASTDDAVHVNRCCRSAFTEPRAGDQWVRQTVSHTALRLCLSNDTSRYFRSSHFLRNLVSVSETERAVSVITCRVQQSTVACQSVKEVHASYGALEVRYRVHNSPTLVSILSQINLLAPELFFFILAHPVYKM